MEIFLHLICGPLLLVIALVFRIYPPKKINWIYGYRTSASMRNQDTWDEANDLSSKLMVGMALAISLFQLVFHFLIPLHTNILIACGLMVVLLLLIVVVVEKHLKQTFDKEGNRISGH